MAERAELPNLDKVVSVIRDHIPGFAIRYKNESWTSKFIAVIVWIFNRRYLTDYTTTRYPRVYFPSREWVAENPRVAVKVLLHEFVHLWDRQQERFWHVIGYGLPQILFLLFFPIFIAALCIPGPTLKWWVTGIAGGLALLSLAPWPAWFRRRAELRGYAMNMAQAHWRYGGIILGQKEWIARHFTGPEYFYMWPFRTRIMRDLARVEWDLDHGGALKPETVEGDVTPYVIVRQLLFPLPDSQE